MREYGYTVPETILIAQEIKWETQQYCENAFTNNQKEWIRERDGNQCQFPVVVKDGAYKPCGRTDHLQVHHAIMPQRFGIEHGWESEDLDVPDNGLTLCESHHNGVVHNDMLVAKLAYCKDKSSFSHAFEKRHEKLANGEKYWNTEFDPLFQRIIRALNKRMGRPYPYSNKQQKKLANGGLKPIPSVEERDHL